MASAVVVGGGLGGLAAALALEQSGHDVAVYEQAEDARREGGSITLWSNGTAVGADGVPSAVRGAIWGGRSSYAGTTCWEGRLSARPNDLPADIAVAIATTSTYAMAFAMPGDTAHWFVDTREPRPEASHPD